MEEEKKVIDFTEFRQRRMAEIKNEATKTAEKIDKRNRVTKTTIVLMVSTAILFDAIQVLFLLIPFLGWLVAAIISIYAWLTFYVWMSIKGWGMSDSVKKITVAWLFPFLETIPILNVLPVWTLRVIMQLFIVKAEDVLYNATQGKVDLEKMDKFYEEYKKVA